MGGGHGRRTFFKIAREPHLVGVGVVNAVGASDNIPKMARQLIAKMQREEDMKNYEAAIEPATALMRMYKESEDNEKTIIYARAMLKNAQKSGRIGRRGVAEELGLG